MGKIICIILYRDNKSACYYNSYSVLYQGGMKNYNQYICKSRKHLSIVEKHFYEPDISRKFGDIIYEFYFT